jgi:hypothetical protein
VNEPLRITLADAARLLEGKQIPYALIGGIAISVHGQTRVTDDVDLIIDGDVDCALALASALDETEFGPFFSEVAEVVERAFILPLLHRKTHLKLDVAVGLSGFEKQAVARAQRHLVLGTVVPVATAEDLLIMKILAGRPQDEQDVHGLVIASGDRLDWDYCQETAERLGEAIGLDLAGRIRAIRGSMD